MLQPRLFPRLLLTFLVILAPLHAQAADKKNNNGKTYKQDTILKEISDFFGAGAKGVGKVVQKVFKDEGEPNAYIKGTEASGAFGIGGRYGNGILYMKSGAHREVHWTGPSIGFDVGGDVSKVFVLVYNLPNEQALFQRFPAVEGSIYVVGGISANYHRSEGITLAPIRLGAGLRTGINVGYMKYTKKKTWNPF